MPKRFSSDNIHSLCKRCRCRCKRCSEREVNLYLVLDDFINGYNIRKMNLPSSSDRDVVHPLPPPLLCMAAERGIPELFTAAFGAKILMMQAADSEISYRVPIIDVNELDATLGPHMSCPCNPIFIPIGSDKLFCIDEGPFEVCHLRPQPDELYPSLTRDHWVWKKLQMPPFGSSLNVCSYAVDNQEQTFYVSSKGDSGDSSEGDSDSGDSSEGDSGDRGDRGDSGTFIFDIEKSVWTHHSSWVLPFNGRGYYDRDLDGFVGISTDPNTLGHLYICDMTNTGTGDSLCPYPDVKCSKVKVFNKNPAEHHVGATLMYMQDSKFCIVECVSLGTLEADQVSEKPEASCGSSYVYHVITFSIGYDKRADVKVKNYRVSSYEVPPEATFQFVNANPVAFWL